MANLFEGRNLEEALTNAASGLGAERYQIKYAIVTEKRGFLGGVKRVVIEASVDLNASAPVAPSRPAAPAAAPAVEEPAEDFFEQPREEAVAREPREPREPRDSRRGRSRDRGNERRRDDNRGRGRRTDSYNAEDEDLLVQGEETPGTSTARAWCEKVVSLAGLQIIVRSEENDNAITLRLHGRDVRRFTEEHGELLDAVQVLANKALVGRTVTKPIELDCGTFKSQRENELADTAREAADKVRKNGREVLLPAMTPIERRIVHVTLQDDPEVTTDSRGDGFLKRVAIIRRQESAAGES